jgi:hypothetical protein
VLLHCGEEREQTVSRRRRRMRCGLGRHHRCLSIWSIAVVVVALPACMADLGDARNSRPAHVELQREGAGIREEMATVPPLLAPPSATQHRALLVRHIRRRIPTDLVRPSPELQIGPRKQSDEAEPCPAMSP